MLPHLGYIKTKFSEWARDKNKAPDNNQTDTVDHSEISLEEAQNELELREADLIKMKKPELQAMLKFAGF